MPESAIIAAIISFDVRINRSTVPFNSEVYTVVLWWMIPLRGTILVRAIVELGAVV